jgi:hypothetical protein
MVIEFHETWKREEEEGAERNRPSWFGFGGCERPHRWPDAVVAERRISELEFRREVWDKGTKLGITDRKGSLKSHSSARPPR